MRVHELAKELGVTSKELLGTLEHMGAAGRSASSSVPEDLVPRLRASGGKAVEVAAPKRREVLEPPPAPRKPKPRAVKKTKVEAASVDGNAAATEAAQPAADVGPASSDGAGAATAIAPSAQGPEPSTSGLPVMQFVRGSTAQTIAEKIGKSPAE